MTTIHLPLCRGYTRLFKFNVTGSALCVPNSIHPSSDVSDCVFQNHTWKFVKQNLDFFKTGGLGKKMSEEWQAWDCSVQPPCSLDTND